MRISDWSSDVCSSDLPLRGDVVRRGFGGEHRDVGAGVGPEGDGPERRLHMAATLPAGRDAIAQVDRAVRRRAGDRKSVVEGKRVSVRVDLGGRRLIKKKRAIAAQSAHYTIHRG